jgi:CheY-like chemotaxis protein
VLVVDDDPDILDLFATALRACGADTTTSDNAVEALTLAARTLPHVIVSDIAMVGEDGYWLIRELRRLPTVELARVPVVAATAYGREHPRSRTISAGFTEHLPKPIDPEMLCGTVARLAGR